MRSDMPTLDMDRSMPFVDSDRIARRISAGRSGVVPIFARGFRFSTKKLGWGDEYKSGGISRVDGRIAVDQYGISIFGKRMGFALKVAPSDSIFIAQDELSGISAVVRLPRITNAKAIGTRITGELETRLSGSWAWPTSRVRARKKYKRVVDDRNPYTYELFRLLMEMAELSIPPERLRSAMLFITGQRAARSSLSVPNANVIMALGAAMFVGLPPSMVAMEAPLEGEGETLVFDHKGGALMHGERQAIAIAGEGRVRCTERIIEEAKRFLAGAELKSEVRERIANHHLPAAAVLWWSKPAVFRSKMGDLAEACRGKRGDELERTLKERYRLLQTYLRRTQRGAREAIVGGRGGSNPDATPIITSGYISSLPLSLQFGLAGSKRFVLSGSAMFGMQPAPLLRPALPI